MNSSTIFLTLVLILLPVLNARRLRTNRRIAEAHVEALSSKGINRCPVSSLINTNVDQTYGYPIEVFHQDEYPGYKNMTSNLTNYEIFNCSAIEYTQPLHLCAAQSTCPITDKLLDVASARSNSRQVSDSICSFADAMYSKDDEIRVFIFGGSVTVGADSRGCCCRSEIDAKCTSLHHNDMCSNHDNPSKTICSWPSRITRWFTSEAYAKVKFYDFSEGGATSPYIAEKIGQKILDLSLGNFTSNDVIFIDHSVNDAISYRFPGMQHVLEGGLESLVRRILHYSIAPNYPTVILLEMFPFRGSMFSVNYLDLPPALTVNYSAVYDIVASHYNIHLWSYKDIVWSSEFINTHSNWTIDAMRFHFNNQHSHQHPPWYIHLYYSDLIAALMKREFTTCFKHRFHKNLVHFYQRTVLPDVLVGSEGGYCDVNYPMLIDFEAQTELDKSMEASSNTGTPAQAVSTTTPPQALQYYNYTPPDTWVIKDERRKKTGWISIFDENANVNTTHTLTFNSSSGGLINSYIYTLRIQYFRTFYNAGIAEVFLCGHSVGNLDALWSDHNNYHISMNQVFVFVYHPSYVNFCTPENFRVDITHRYATDSFMHARTKQQKFKVVSVKVCRQVPE